MSKRKKFEMDITNCRNRNGFETACFPDFSHKIFNYLQRVHLFTSWNYRYVFI